MPIQLKLEKFSRFRPNISRGSDSFANIYRVTIVASPAPKYEFEYTVQSTKKSIYVL